MPWRKGLRASIVERLDVPMFEDRGAIGYDHSYDARVFYRSLALDPKYVEGFIEWITEDLRERPGEGGC